ncbi:MULTISPECIES: hypothetical protein [Rhodococcus]|uniref:hypothetical protein n=1 Tax=Rhodococcus TaxID=1827 RepID=UPI000F528F95|nr:MULTISPECIES: hypothetical protein [Rhodococcus]MDO1482126.1 hypothetical protein [Rhodococcus ruber]WKK14760.1 hypothetical protein QYN14_26050 [Rhodococcus ruber]
MAQTVAPVQAVLSEVNAILEQELPTITDCIASGDKTKLFGLGSGFFHFPVAIFLENSGGDRAGAMELATTLALGHGYFYSLDRLLDDRIVEHPLVLASPIMLSTYLSRLENTSNDRGMIRTWHDEYYKIYVQAQLYEWKLNRTLPPLSNDDLRLLEMKSAPVCLPIRIAASKSHKMDSDSLEVAFLNYSAGLQLMDDLSDVREDFANGLSSIPIRFALVEAMGYSAWPNEGEISPDDVSFYASKSGVHEQILSLADQFFAVAAEQASNANLGTLKQLAMARRELCDQRRAASNELRY